MNCKKCGNILEVTDKFCKMCGEPVNNMNVQAGNLVNTEPVNNVNMQASNFVNPEPLNNVNTQASNFVNPEPVNNVNMQASNFVNPEPVNNVNMQASNFINPEPVNNVNNQTMPASNELNNKSSNSLFKVIVIVLIVIIVVLASIFIIKKLSSKNELKENTNNQDEISNDEIEEDNTQVTNDNIFKYKNFELPIIDNYNVKQANGMIQFINENSKIISQIQIMEWYTLEDFELELEEYKKTIIETGAKINSVKTEKIEGIETIIFDVEMTKNGEKMNIINTINEIGEYHTCINLIINMGNTDNEEIIKQFANMYKNIKYNGETEFSGENKSEIKIPTLENIDFAQFD